MNLMAHWHSFWMGGMWVFPLLMMLIMVIAIFLCARVFLGRDFRPPCAGQGERILERGESALEIAKRRFAQGEITKEEFEEIKKTIA